MGLHHLAGPFRIEQLGEAFRRVFPASPDRCCSRSRTARCGSWRKARSGRGARPGNAARPPPAHRARAGPRASRRQNARHRRCRQNRPHRCGWPAPGNCAGSFAPSLRARAERQSRDIWLRTPSPAGCRPADPSPNTRRPCLPSSPLQAAPVSPPRAAAQRPARGPEARSPASNAPVPASTWRRDHLRLFIGVSSRHFSGSANNREMSRDGRKASTPAGRAVRGVLARLCGKKLERAKGIEPSYAAWEAAVLPLNYARAPSPLSRSGQSLVKPKPQPQLTPKGAQPPAALSATGRRTYA